MTTAQYISWLSKRIGGNLFSRTDLLDAVNQAQNEILGRDCFFMRVKADPFFRTTAGTNLYTASSAIYDSEDGTTQFDIRKVSRVYTTNIRSSGIYEYGGINRTTHRPETMINPLATDETIIPSDCTQSISPNSSDCKVQLWRENDPGTTTIVYLAECYKWPTQLTAETVALSTPEQFQRGLLRYAVLKDLEYTEYGSNDKPEVLFDRELKKFDNWANSGAKTILTCTPPREC